MKIVDAMECTVKLRFFTKVFSCIAIPWDNGPPR